MAKSLRSNLSAKNLRMEMYGGRRYRGLKDDDPLFNKTSRNKRDESPIEYYATTLLDPNQFIREKKK